MKKLTKKQRGEIYLRAAEIVANNKYNFFLCGVLWNLLNGVRPDETGYNYTMDGTLAEFELFKPTKQEEDDNVLWWMCSTSGINDRIVRQTCMLLCYEMTKP